MALETKFSELAMTTVPAHGEKELSLAFSQPVKLVELQHSPGVRVKNVRIGDNLLEAEAYKGEVAPASMQVIATLANDGDKDVAVRAGWYVEQEITAVAAVAATPPTPPVAAPPAYVPPAAADPYTPPPPGGVSQFQMGNQQITVTTPVNGANGLPPAHEPPVPLPGIHSYQMGGQQIRVSNPIPQTAQSQGSPQTAHSHVLAAVLDKRIVEGPSTVTCGAGEVAILLKRAEAEQLLSMCRGAILHPGYYPPIERAIKCALGETA